MSNKCLNCGAKTKDKDLFNRVCPYCGSVFVKSPFGLLDFINEERAKRETKELQEKIIDMQKEAERLRIEKERDKTRQQMIERIKREKRRKNTLMGIFGSLIPISWIACYILYRNDLIGENAGVMGGFLFSLFFVIVIVLINNS